MRKFRRDGVHLFVLAWVLSALLVAVLWGIGELQRLRDEFESVAQRAHALVARKLDQNESVLASVDALMVASRPFEAAALGTFARELLPHYPQLHSFVFFQSVSMSERQAFLHQMSGKFGETFYIRDFDVAGRREWRPAAVRPQSLVISMLEPDRPEAGPMFGYDILGMIISGLPCSVRWSRGGGYPVVPSNCMRAVAAHICYCSRCSSRKPGRRVV